MTVYEIAREVYIGNVSGEYTGYRNDSAQLTVDVRAWTAEAPYVAISAGVRYRVNRDYMMCGQIREALDHVVRYRGLWNARQADRLGQIWDRWHLVEPVPAEIISELERMFK